MNKKKAINNLVDVSDILSEHECVWWLEAGTCLGFYREKDFIDHDNDIDIGVLQTTWKWEVLEELLQKGFHVKHIFGMYYHGFEIALIRDDVKVDIFFFYKDQSTLWHAAWKNGGRNGLNDMLRLKFSEDIIGGLTWTDKIYGFEFPIPKKTEKYLVARYGTDWEIPCKNWKWWADPKCIV